MSAVQFISKTPVVPYRKTMLTEDDRFRRLLPSTAWEALPETVQRRFSTKAKAGASLIYRGVTTELKLSLPGRVLAQAARIVGAPLPFDEKSERRPAIVTIMEDTASGGQIWTRLYGRRNGFPQSVNSTKRFSGPTGLEEHVGGGVSMSLTLAVEEGALYFKSANYFLTLLGARLQLPKALAPGRMVIGHHDLGVGAFAFTLTLTHPLFGVLISQTTIFHDMTEAGNA